MSELTFAILGVRVEPYAATPTLVFRLRVEAPGGETIHTLALRCQIRIEPQRRHYATDEGAGLEELFGMTERWGDTLKPFLWTHVSTMAPGFTGAGEIDLAVPCTYDFDVAASKYLHALEGGEIPLLFLFSGTVFAKGEGGLRVTQIPWDRETRHRLPVATWRELMDCYYPNAGWLRLRRDTLDALLSLKARRAVATFDEVIDMLLAGAGEHAA
jgi:hypothetical protein